MTTTMSTTTNQTKITTTTNQTKITTTTETMTKAIMQATTKETKLKQDFLSLLKKAPQSCKWRQKIS